MAQTNDLNSNQTNVFASVGNLVTNAVNQYIVRPTGGNSTLGINGFVFDIMGEEEITLESEITDHYVEDNYAIQDHIAQKPIKYIAKGFVGELVNLFPNQLLSILTTVQTLANVLPFQPVFTAQANQTYNDISELGNQVSNVINQAKNINALLTNAITTATKQQEAYSKFLGFWSDRTLCTIETPFAILPMMAIERVSPMQPDSTNLYSEFSVSFKQIRLATTLTSPITINNPAGSGSMTLANYAPSLDSSNLSSGLLGTSVTSIEGNTLGRVSQNVNPVDINGQTTGTDVTGNPIAISFGLITT